MLYQTRTLFIFLSIIFCASFPLTSRDASGSSPAMRSNGAAVAGDASRYAQTILGSNSIHGSPLSTDEDESRPPIERAEDIEIRDRFFEQVSAGSIFVRHAPLILGRLQGSIQQMSAENVILGGEAAVSGDLLVPGTPRVLLLGHPTYGGTLEGTGNPLPAHYWIMLKDRASLRHVIRRTDPVALPSVGAPPKPTGTRTVELHAPGQNPGDFATIRNLVVRGRAGQVAVPPGTYGDFSAAGRCGFILGVAGTTQPSLYNFQRLTLFQNSRLEVAGPVVVTVASGFTYGGEMVPTGDPARLTLNVHSGRVTLLGASTLSGNVIAPRSRVTVNRDCLLAGYVACDRLVIAKHGLLQLAAVSPNQPLVVSLTAPSDGAVFTASSPITLEAVATDADGTIVKVEFFDGSAKLGDGAPDAGQPSLYRLQLPAGLAVGKHALAARATDDSGAQAASNPITIEIEPTNNSPTVTITAPAAGAIYQAPAAFTLAAAAADADGRVVKVEFFQGEAKLGEVAEAPYQWTIADLAAGSYAFRARATDDDGAATESETVSIIVNALPSVSITFPADGSVFAAPADITLQVAAGDADGTIAKVEFYNGSAKLGEATSEPYQFVWSGVSAGQYSLTAKATDNLGATSTSAPVTVTVKEGIPPSVTLVSPEDRDIIFINEMITFEAIAFDPDGAITKVEFLNGTTVLGEGVPDPSDPASFTLQIDVDWLEGDYLLTVRATDDIGLTTTAAPVSAKVVPLSSDSPLEQFLEAGALTLAGVSPDTFNPVSAQVRFVLNGAQFYQEPNEVYLLVNDEEIPTSSLALTPQEITASSILVEGSNEIALYAYDDVGRPLYYRTVLWAGSCTLTVNLVNGDGQPFMEQADVRAELCEDQSVSAQAAIDTGTVQFQNLPDRTILIKAGASGNRCGLTGDVGAAGTVSVCIQGFGEPSAVDNNDFSQGTAGWEIGEAAVMIVPHTEGLPEGSWLDSFVQSTGTSPLDINVTAAILGETTPPVASPPWRLAAVAGAAAGSIEDQDLVVWTEHRKGPNSVSRTFNTQLHTTGVVIRYRFITREVPGGWFGTGYNDYFSVSLRSLQGGGAAGEANSMNGLGLGAFDYHTGATAWREVKLPVDPKGDTISVNVTVANVGDNKYDSYVEIDFVKELCDQVTPYLEWNGDEGGLDLTYTVRDGALNKATTISLYWASGPNLSDRIGAPFFTSPEIPVGTPEGEDYGPIRVTGAILTDPPEGVSHILAITSEMSVTPLEDVNIEYGPHANQEVVSEKILYVIKGGLRVAGQATATITSTSRTPADQARAMFNNLMYPGTDGVLSFGDIAHNIEVQRKVYRGVPGNDVVTVFENDIQTLTLPEIIENSDSIKADMEQKIIELGPNNVSHHCGDFSKLCVVDVSSSDFSDQGRVLFRNTVKPQVRKFLEENRCFHIESKVSPLPT